MTEPSDPRIEVIDANIDRPELLRLYGAADCLVACSRGEASGLTPREAMSTGIPAIVTGWGGMLEIADPEYAFVLDIEGEEPAFGPIYPMRTSGGARMGRLATPSVDHLRVLMREAYENPERTREMGRNAARWIRSEWSYERCAKRWLEAIGGLVSSASNGNGTAR
jgi:glycosyltransferase involved in cell wall biosynthesis